MRNLWQDAAAEALGKLDDRRAIKALIGTLSDPQPHVRWKSAQALGKLDALSAVEHLKKLTEDENVTVRGTARDVLEELQKKK